ncbi:5-bromo-4-chloroindolyl phosphate hydrolysis family protein [Aliiroseovarius crassostreae]|uniref:5-bromo-4-chloroindolyl phosphate hydrolysis family protein n=1 Tax=Aliiroseovarius crassostreae TaxID=154981 RepID=UPI00220B81D7|nr:5-bromo-4-chloroindolyl phosphate hydrolysis family protein [Aliiroseovarius crassostreae]UWP88282.1 5-bromo-4-chloroindolyl phosphate hydrolysis family protein [Aliiroseovarius crassostreae]
MAQRYGGDYSPNGSKRPERDGQNAPRRQRSPFEGTQPARAGARVNLLFLAPLPLVGLAFFRDPAPMALSLVGAGLLLAAAWLTREGVAAHEAYDARKVARRPAFPRKIFAAILTGAGLAAAGLVQGSMIEAALYAILGTGLHLFSFGLDPLKNKATEGVDTFQTDRVARVVEEAEAQLGAMSRAVDALRDRHLTARVETFQLTARDMFRVVEDDPRDLTAARKFLSVYLRGARDATVKFTELYTRSHDATARRDYEALLDDLEQNFAAKTQALLSDNRTDLEVEIEVLRDRLAREGVRMDKD